MEVYTVSVRFVMNEISGIDISISMEDPALSICLVVFPLAEIDLTTCPFLNTEAMLMLILISLSLIDSFILLISNKLVFGWDIHFESAHFFLSNSQLDHDSIID
jgi:membrane-associated HD superfamily phosphohydrolase